MKKYKIEEKLFLSKAIISNVHSMRLKNRYSDNERNETLVDESIELAVLMLEKRNLLFGESEKSQSVKKHIPEVDFDVLMDYFNSTCKDLPKISKLTKERQNLVIKILEFNTNRDVLAAFEKVEQSDYLSGRKVGSDWKATFDWIFIPKNFIKILEGNYDNRDAVEAIEKEQKYGRMPESTVQKNFNTFLNSVPNGE